MSNEWRRIVAALTNPELRRVYAEVILAEHRDRPPLAPARRARAVRSLTDAGLVRPGPAGSMHADDELLARLLATGDRATRQGVERFLRAGRIDRYPARASERRELLVWIIARALPDHDDRTESQVNDALLDYTDDVSTLRRYLVDAELLERTPSGSAYRRVHDSAGASGVRNPGPET
ncbi:DUF2087 domain-containing protein [Cryobacterium sp. AP23]